MKCLAAHLWPAAHPGPCSAAGWWLDILSCCGHTHKGHNLCSLQHEAQQELWARAVSTHSAPRRAQAACSTATTQCRPAQPPAPECRDHSHSPQPPACRPRAPAGSRADKWECGARTRRKQLHSTPGTTGGTPPNPVPLPPPGLPPWISEQVGSSPPPAAPSCSPSRPLTKGKRQPAPGG